MKKPALPGTPTRRALILCAIALAVALPAYRLTKVLANLGISEGYAPQQPIAFSHALHAGTYSIPCLYCHFGAETSRHAGIPPTSLCMGCHNRIEAPSAEFQKLVEAAAQERPIEWVKVHRLPDFVYFNHSQHVSRGVQCEACHGAVEEMERLRQASSLSMGWCLDCHRSQGITEFADRRRFVETGHSQETFGGMDCSKCHY